MKPIPTTVEDFKVLCENYYFIDKSWMIADILARPAQVSLFTRPRRFGKTLTLAMLAYFFNIQYAKDSRAMFADLAIAKLGNALDFAGTKPVLFFSLKNLDSEDFPTFLACFAGKISLLYNEHSYLLQSDCLLDADRKYFNAILDAPRDIALLTRSLVSLMLFMQKYYQKKVVVLIDEYDAPIISAWDNNYYKQGISLLRGFLGDALKTNSALDFAILTGVERVAKESIFSGLNSFQVFSVLSSHFSAAIGYTEEDIQKIMHDFNLEDKFEELKSWYDGYIFGDTEIYNPWSVNNYIYNKCVPEPYWINTSGNTIIAKMMLNISSTLKEKLDALLTGKSIATLSNENIIFSDLEDNENSLFMLLLTAGYLKCVRKYRAYARDWVELQIPNYEIAQAYENEILQRFSGKNLDLPYLMLAAMQSGSGALFQEKLASILCNYVSTFDAAHPEYFYHGLMLAFGILLAKSYVIKSNQESGYGRFDLAFFPKDKRHSGVILEFKVEKNVQRLKSAAKKALKQIAKQAYLTEFSKEEVQTVWQYGIAFAGKHVEILQG